MPSNAAARPRSPFTHRQAAAWAVWMTLQWATLACFASQLPLTAKLPSPVEDSALRAMIFVQLLGLVLLSPVLLADRRGLVAALAGGWPMTVAAAGLADADGASTAGSALVLSTWAAVLTTRTGRTGSPALALYLIAPPVAAYAASEAGRPAASAWIAKAMPIVQSSPTSLHPLSLLPVLLAPFVLAASFRVIDAVRRPIKSIA